MTPSQKADLDRWLTTEPKTPECECEGGYGDDGTQVNRKQCALHNTCELCSETTGQPNTPAGFICPKCNPWNLEYDAQGFIVVNKANAEKVMDAHPAVVDRGYRDKIAQLIAFELNCTYGEACELHHEISPRPMTKDDYLELAGELKGDMDREDF